MRLEREIQDWIVGLARARTLSSVLRYGKDPLSQEMEALVHGFGPDSGLSPSRHRSVHEACRVLKSLIEPRFSGANKNISDVRGEQLLPDLVLEDEISSAFVVVELKRCRKAAREFATELLAYAHCLTRQHPGSQVFLVLVSASWAPLEQHAISEMARRNIPVLPLEYRDVEEGETTQTLRVRSDLLPVANVEPFPPSALLVDTKTFLMPAHWRLPMGQAPWLNRIEHAVAGLVREAEKAGSSGFVIVWFHPHEKPYHAPDEPELRLYVSMAVRNPCRPDMTRMSKQPLKGDPFAGANSFYPLTDDTAVRLLLGLEVGGGVRSYSSESEGTWSQLHARLEDENAFIVRFDSFGEIGDQVSNWRTHKRYMANGVIPDITILPSWHPLTWLSALESLIESTDQEEEDAVAWHAYHRGQHLGRLCGPEFLNCKDSHFGWAVAQARFASAWCDYFASHSGAPSLSLYRLVGGIRCDDKQVEHAINFAAHQVEKEGELAHCCFALGYHDGSSCDNLKFLVDKRSVLRARGIALPPALDAKLDELERRLGSSFRPANLFFRRDSAVPGDRC